MNKKIGIVTIYGLDNYGNRLQNYAVHKIFQDLGYDSVSLVCVKSKAWNIAHNLLRIVNTIRGIPEYKRRTAFYKFVKRTTPTQYVYSKDMRIPNSVAEDFLCFFTGSDQVWNPEVRVLEKHNYFLLFAPLEKRFCIAPSFGVSAIPMRFVNDYKNWLEDINYLSCREVEGVRIIKDLTGKEAEVLIDPTMMLSHDKWKEIYKEIIIPAHPYLLLYFLGDMSEDKKNLINLMSQQYQLEVIDILKNKDSAYFNLFPDGLLQMIENASIVCTDSFHVAAFSINFNIPFYVFDRQQKESFGKNMISRIANLLSLFGLSERLNPRDISNALNCDFSSANCIIEIERKKEIDYLMKCLKKCQQ